MLERAGAGAGFRFMCKEGVQVASETPVGGTWHHHRHMLL